MRVSSTRKLWLILWMLILASTAGCFQSAGGALESTDAAQLLMTYTPVITDTPIPSPTFEEPTPFPSLTPTPDANALEVIIVSPTFDLMGTQVADASLQDDIALTTTAAYLTNVAPLLQQEIQPPQDVQPIEPIIEEQQVDDPLLLSATAVVREATQTAEAGPTLTAQAELGITPTLPVQSPIPGETAIPGTDCIHEVRVGDRNLYRIGLAYGVTYQAIAQASGILTPHLIYIGQRLTIPGCGTTGQQPPATSTPSAGATSVPGSGSGQTYIVQQGDTLFALSLRWGVLVNQIAAVNGISNINLIYIGQQLIIP